MDDRELTEDEVLGVAWWNGLTEKERAFWLQAARSAVPADAWAFWKRQEGVA